MRLGIVQINVTDLNRAWQFYAETLGMPAPRKFGPNRAFELNVGGPVTVLVYPVASRRTVNYPEDTGPLLVFMTSDIASTVADWRSRGVEFIPIAWSTRPDGIAYSPYGRFIAFKDPDGNVHELIQPD